MILSHEIIKFIVGEEPIKDKQSDEVSEDATYNISEGTRIGEEPIEKMSWAERRPTAGREGKSTQFWQMINDDNILDEEKLMKHRKMSIPKTEYSEDEPEEEEEKETERPFYDIESRGRELRDQEEKNDRDLDELRINLDFMESNFCEIKKMMNRDLKKLIKDLRTCKEEDLEEDVMEAIEAIVAEENLSSIESDDGEE